MRSIQEKFQISALDLRLMIMSMVLVVMALAFHVATGNFLSPENLYNIAQQSAVVGIVAAAIGLVIVARQIDLSVGSVLATVGVAIAYLMYSKGWNWVPASLVGLAISLAVYLYQGWLSAYLGVASFVVTLGGLVSFRGIAFLFSDGRTQPISDPTFLLIGGGLDGAIGTTASWTLGLVASLVIVANTFSRRRSMQSHGLEPRPVIFDFLISGFFIAVVLLFVGVMCAYQIESKTSPQGIPNPVLIWAVVVAFISFIVNRTSFGRYIYAIGGNPEAANLVGIPVRWVTLKIYLLLGVMTTIAAMVAISRLNAGTASLGTGMELYAIAGAVIGGVALSGGSGSVLGTVLGALIIQFLESGLLLMEVGVGQRLVIIGQVLIVAVVFDVMYRRATGERL
ncbi:ABC transporter permease [Rhodoferax lacus]|uniref:Xylose transport system permease protein XylH n=1 Tax=Rhodoferax lacus TaxID=2184758 RepID=A0A3E1R5M7_9BURK|nr:ABC transporter permease [Rhodoferax lacus]RFO94685.1 ABC transporter permease [Rhodoferax lacus]